MDKNCYYFHTKDLSVGYKGKPLIRDISIGLHKGEILTLIGPNGSGKSTILKSITKHLQAIAGDSFVEEISVKSLSYKELSKKMAVVLTERLRPEMMSCRDIVSTGRYPYTGTMGILSEEDKKIVDEALQKVHGEDLSDRDFLSISDGQKQRILLARAICQKPEIIILDEPTSFLDIKHKLELLTILRQMAKDENITVIMSLHEIDLAQKISDKIMCVKGEMIENFGTPKEIFTKEIITSLYEIEEGAYNISFGSVELPKPVGEAKTFVISSCGSGIEVFRTLQKEKIPFYCGIIYENDLDYSVAGSLAMEVVTATPFEEITDEQYARAIKLIDLCDHVIKTDFPIGKSNKRIEDLVKYAEMKDILECR